MRIGLVSDSHGLAEAALEPLLAGCDLILHAGDAVRPEVLAPLRRLAPLAVVRGNNDLAPGLARLPLTRLVACGPLAALLVHDLGPLEAPHPALARLLAARSPRLVVHGHSHRPAARLHGGVLFVNPGSAGPRRFSLPRSAGILLLDGRHARVRLLDLEASPPAPLGPDLQADL